MNYIIVTSWDLDTLAEMVNLKIEEGYVPCGSIIATKFNYSQPARFAQPMIKNG
jgi:hypothetical protein